MLQLLCQMRPLMRPLLWKRPRLHPRLLLSQMHQLQRLRLRLKHQPRQMMRLRSQRLLCLALPHQLPLALPPLAAHRLVALHQRPPLPRHHRRLL